MTARWYVVNATTGVRYEPGHLTEAEALLELADRYADLPCTDSPGRYEVQQQPVTPWAYAVPMQTSNR